MKRFLFFTLIIFSARYRTSAQPRNIPVIIIISDQLRNDAIGKYTPHINQLKSDGVSFDRTYCASPICVPSRAAFFTGKFPSNNGSLINGWSPQDMRYREVKSGTPNLYEAMAENWDSWHIGKQHFFTRDKIDKNPKSKTKWITLQTFKQWDKSQGVKPPGGTEFGALSPELSSGGYTHVKRYTTPKYEVYEPGLKYFDDDFFADKAVDIINNDSSSKPLLLNIMFVSPHPPYHIPEPYFSKFKKADFNFPANVGEWYAGQSPLQLYNLPGFFGSRYSKEDWEDIWPKYFGLVSLVDDEVGKVITALKSKGIYDKALIIFTADHGEMLGSHSLWQKMCMYEESSHVPLIIKFPESFRPAFKETNSLVSLIDVWPTLIDYLNIKVDGKTDGISLMPLLKGAGQPQKKVFIQYDGNGGYGNNQRCVVDGDYKLIIDTFKGEAFLELYNVVKDREETENLAMDPKFESKTKVLIAEIQEHMAITNDLLKLPGDIYKIFTEHYLIGDQKSAESD